MPDGQYCGGREQPGLLVNYAPRLRMQVNRGKRLIIGASFRYQMDAGEGSLANFLSGLRVGANIIEPTDDVGVRALAFVGTSYGQIQLHPGQNGDDEPYMISGLNGVQIGGTVGYWFMKNVGIFVTPEVHILFPTFLLNIDITAGISIGI